VGGSQLRFERGIDLPRPIVWDALVDADLVSGWLAEASVDPRVGGRYDLQWRRGGALTDSTGTIELMSEPDLLRVDTSALGRITFSLAEVSGGTRDTQTLLTVTVEVDTDPRFAAVSRAHWLCNLDQLQDLLRGHPVDWDSWEADYGAAWERHWDEVSGIAR